MFFSIMCHHCYAMTDSISHSRRMDLSIIIIWMSPLCVCVCVWWGKGGGGLGIRGDSKIAFIYLFIYLFIYFFFLIKYFRMFSIDVVRSHIWGFTFVHVPLIGHQALIKKSHFNIGVKHHLSRIDINYKCEQSSVNGI